MLRTDLPIPLPFHYLVDYDDDDGIDADQAAADVGRFIVPWKCQVVEAQLVITETCAGSTTTPVVAFDSRPTVGSDTNRGAADIANFACSTTAAGKVLYDLAGRGVELEPGEEVVVQLVTRPTGDGDAAGHFIPVLLVEHVPETKANLSNMTLTA